MTFGELVGRWKSILCPEIGVLTKQNAILRDLVGDTGVKALEVQKRLEEASTALLACQAELSATRAVKIPADVLSKAKAEREAYPIANVRYAGYQIHLKDKVVKPEIAVQDFIQVLPSHRKWLEQRGLLLSIYLENNPDIPFGDVMDELLYDIYKAYAPTKTYAYDSDLYGVDEQWAPALDSWYLKKADCLTGDTKIICLNEDEEYENIPICELKKRNIKVLSYNFDSGKCEFKKIVSVMDKGKQEVYRLYFRNGGHIDSTVNHRFFDYLGRDIPVKSLLNVKPKTGNSFKRSLQCCRIIPCIDKPFVYDNADPLLYVIGAYLAEGYMDKTHSKTTIYISGDGDSKLKDKVIKFCEEFNLPFIKKFKYVSFNCALRPDIYELFFELGTSSDTKRIPPKYLSMSKREIQIVLDGYCDGDGYVIKEKTKQHYKNVRGITYNHLLVYNTISNDLAESLSLLHYILGKPLWKWFGGHGGAGKRNRGMIWRLHENTNSHFSREHQFPSLSKVSYKKAELLGVVDVFDIEVEDNHNFFLSNSGVLAHNCENSSNELLALFEAAGITGDLRSFTWNVCGYTFTKVGHSTVYAYDFRDDCYRHIESTATRVEASGFHTLPKNKDSIDVLNLESVWWSYNSDIARNSWVTDAAKDTFRKRDRFRNIIIKK